MVRAPSTNRLGSGFDAATIEAVWNKGTPEVGYMGFRKDSCGASMQRTKYGQTEQWGWEIDHIKPWHEGGKTTAENCQLLCKDDNRRKSGK